MSSKVPQHRLMLTCVLLALCGCASVPPSRAVAQNGAPSKGPTDTGVQQTSAIMPADDGSIVGPPPSIPVALPAPPRGAVSIDDAKAKAEKKSGFELSDLAPENVYKGFMKATGNGPDERIATAAMDEGRALFNEKKYTEAAAKFAIAAKRWPDSPMEEDALFSRGECEFFTDQYPKSHDTYGGLLKKYSNTRHLNIVATREFTIGQYWEQLQNKKPLWLLAPNMTDNSRPLFDTEGSAIKAYERVRLNDPTGPLADDSLMAMGNAYFRAGRFEDAAYNYDQLRKEYPNSDHQAKAHILALQAKMRIYQGTMYVSDPLDDAEKIANETLTQFGDKLGDERQRIVEARAKIIEEKANRLFAFGQFYEGRRCGRAARMYYQNVIKDYPSTAMAKQAKERLESIRNMPDDPPNYFKWVGDILEPKKR